MLGQCPANCTSLLGSQVQRFVFLVLRIQKSTYELNRSTSITALQHHIKLTHSMQPLYISCLLYSSDEYFYLLLAHFLQFTVFFLLYKIVILQARILTYSHKKLSRATTNYPHEQYKTDITSFNMLGFTTILECFYFFFSFLSGLNKLLHQLLVKQVLYISCNNCIMWSKISHTENIFTTTSTLDINMKRPRTKMKEHQQHTDVICVKFIYKWYQSLHY